MTGRVNGVEIMEGARLRAQAQATAQVQSEASAARVNGMNASVEETVLRPIDGGKRKRIVTRARTVRERERERD